MKKLITKWLLEEYDYSFLSSRITDINRRLRDLELKEEDKEIHDIVMSSDGVIKERGVWEHIYSILNYLKIHPREIWEDDPNKLIEKPKRRYMKMVKDKKT